MIKILLVILLVLIGNDNTLEVNGDINLASGKKFKINNKDISLFGIDDDRNDINYKGKLYYGFSNENTGRFNIL